MPPHPSPFAGHVPSWTRLVLLVTGVVVRPHRQRVVGGHGPLISGLTIGAVALAISGILAWVDGSIGDAGGALVGGLLGLVLFGWFWSIGGFRIDADGLTPRRFPFSRAPSRYRWEEIRRLRIRPEFRIQGVIAPEFTAADRPSVLDPSMVGTAGMLRTTRPIRILAAAAAGGALPPTVTVEIHGSPRLPSARAALRLLERHHPAVIVGPHAPEKAP